jgi:hypothetical protein
MGSAQARLMPIVWRGFEAVRGSFPRAERGDLYHELPYDPMVPLIDEVTLSRDALRPREPALRAAYRRLARTLTRLHPRDEVLEIPGSSAPPPVFVREDA